MCETNKENSEQDFSSYLELTLNLEVKNEKLTMALNAIWQRLGVNNQTAAMEKLNELLDRR